MFSGKNDLSAGKATVDFQLLLKTVSRAVGTARIQCERELSRFQNACMKSDTAAMDASAKSLAEFSAVLADASEMFHLLTEAGNRETLVVTNRIKGN